MDSVRQRPLRGDLDHPPTEEELEEALDVLKINKAGGKNELTPTASQACQRGFWRTCFGSVQVCMGRGEHA